MGEGIKYVFEVEGKGEESLAVLDAKLAATEERLPKIKEHSEDAARGHAKHAHEAKGLHGVLDRLVHAGMEPFLHKAKEIAEFEFIRRTVDALIDAPSELAEKIKELGEEMILTAAKAERLDLSFKLTLGQEGAEEILGWIERISSKTEFTDDQLKGWASSLLRAGVKAEDVDKFLAAGLDTAAKSANKMEGMEAAISALSRAQLTGRVETRALRGLSIGVDELKQLPEFAGLSDKALHKKITEGSISKDELLALIAGPGGVLGDLGVTAGKTFEAQLKNVKEIPEQIFQGLYKTAGFQELGDFLGHLFDTFGPESEAGKAAAEALAEVLDEVAAKLQSIDLDVVAKTVSGALEQLPAAIETAADLFGSLAHGIGFVVDLLTVFADGIGAVLKVMDPFGLFKTSKADQAKEFAAHRDPAEVAFEKEQRDKLAALRTARAAGKTFVDEDAATHPGESPLARRRRRIEEIRGEQREAGRAMADGLYEGANAGKGKAGDAGSKIADAATGATKDKLGIHSPSKAFADLGRETVAGFTSGVESSSAEIDDVLRGAFAIPAPQGGRFSAVPGAPIVVNLGGIEIHVAGGVNATAQDVAEAARPMVRDELVRVFEGMRAEGLG